MSEKHSKIITGTVSFIILPTSIYQGWLLYNKVQATDLMWFLFWFNQFLIVVFNIVGMVVASSIEDKD